MAKKLKITIHRAGYVFDTPTAEQLRSFEDGALAVNQDGLVEGIASFKEIKKLFRGAKIVDHGAHTVITPGFVDCHIHAPQFEKIAATGFTLLDWLENHIFPTEAQYSDLKHAKKAYGDFCAALLRAGTTTSAIYGTSHTAATELLMKLLDKSGLRAFVGKVLMDRNAPQNLVQKAQPALEELEGLIKRWSKHERVKPSITVRFAATSTVELLKGAGSLAQKYPDLVVQTHIAETQDEIRWIKELFPTSQTYAQVYDAVGLVHGRTLLAHGIHLEDSELGLISRRQAHIVHCPSSNLFLGSGIFNFARAKDHQVSVCLGSDVGAGWVPSLQTTLRCCYEVQALQKHFMKPSEVLHLATRAGAKALGLDNLGYFEKGYLADFVVNDLERSPTIFQRSKTCESPEELLSTILYLGGEFSVAETYVQGKSVYKIKKGRS